MNWRQALLWAALAWTAVFALAHLIWAFGLPLGFPDGPESHQLMMTSAWRYSYNWIVILLCVAAAFAIWLAIQLPSTWRSRLAATVLLVASLLLLLRGSAGLIFDTADDLVWGSVFVVGGALFASLGIASLMGASRSASRRGRG